MVISALKQLAQNWNLNRPIELTLVKSLLDREGIKHLTQNPSVKSLIEKVVNVASRSGLLSGLTSISRRLPGICRVSLVFDIALVWSILSIYHRMVQDSGSQDKGYDLKFVTTSAESIGSAPGMYVSAKCQAQGCENNNEEKWIRYERSEDVLVDMALVYGPNGVECSSCKNKFNKESIADKIAFCEGDYIVKRGTSEPGVTSVVKEFAVKASQGQAKIVEWDGRSPGFVLVETERKKP